METLKKKARAVKFDKYGGIDVLHIDEVPVPMPEKGQVLVRVMAAGINPGEAAIRQGYVDKQWPAHFPSGQGSDFAGVIEKVGDNVNNFKIGDEVIGFTDDRASQAEYVMVDANHLIRRPSHVSWEQAGSLFVVGTTAYAAIRAVGLRKGETLVVSGAAGGVGSIVVQLARNIGARVIGLASKSNHEWITKHGGIPVTYGEGMLERIKSAAAVDASGTTTTTENPTGKTSTGKSGVNSNMNATTENPTANTNTKQPPTTEGATGKMSTGKAGGTSNTDTTINTDTTNNTSSKQQPTTNSQRPATSRIDAFIDTYGHGYVDLALALGVKPERIDTIIDFDAAHKHHVKTDGNAKAAKASVLAELANLIDKGRLEIPIARIYNLNDVRDAYQELEKRHTHGKIVLVP